MNPIRILIADDDAGMRLVMRKLAEQAEGYELVGEAEDGEKLIELYDSLKPEVVLMDVEMPGMTGIECARAIQDRDPRTVLVFATAHEEYMASAFEVYAFDYLVKPFRVERAMQTLERIRQRLRGGAAEPMDVPDVERREAPVEPVQGRMMLKHRDGISFIDIPQIAMVMRENRATILLMQDGTRYVVSDGMAELDERLRSLDVRGEAEGPEGRRADHPRAVRGIAEALCVEAIDEIQPIARSTRLCYNIAKQHGRAS